MAIFASTTTSGYSDPLKAASIKALEARMLAQQQQMAQQQPDTASMATIPGGIGHVLGVVGDRMQQARIEGAAAEGRNELAGVISQGPKGPEGNWAPEQLAVMARRSPELMEKFYQQQHDMRYQKSGQQHELARDTGKFTHETGLQTTRLASEDARAEADRKSREGIVATQEGGATGRTVATLSSEEARQKERLAAEATNLGSKQSHDANMARLNAELDDAKQQKLFAQQNNQLDKANEQQVRIANLTAELTSAENRRGESFKASQLQQQFAQDDKLKGLEREAVAANLEKQLANQTGNNQARIAADEKLARLQGEITQQRDFVKQAFEVQNQSTQNRHDLEKQARAIKSTESIAEAEAKAKAEALRTDPKRAEAVRGAETAYRKGLSHIDNLEEAAKILDHPDGIYTGAMQTAAPTLSGLPGVGGMIVDKEKAQRTSRFNTIVGEDAIRDMAETLKGSSTNYEMGEFKKMKNDPNISDAQRANQLRKVVQAAKADLEAQAKETQTIGGDTARVEKAMSGGGGAPPKPAGMSDAAILSEAQGHLKNATPEQAAKINARLKAWGLQ